MNSLQQRSILVWDLPVRVFHALLAGSFIGAFVTAESERWRLVHVTLGYTVAALVVFRVVWGSGRHAARALRRLRARAAGGGALPRFAAARPARTPCRAQPGRRAGHRRPARAGAGGRRQRLAVDAAAGGAWLEGLHEAAADLMLALVVVHVAGVLVGSWLHRENLVRGMVTGRKLGTADEGIGSAWRSVGVLVLLAVLGFWAWQWQTAPAPADRPAHTAELDADDD